MNARLVTCAKQ